MPLLAWSCALWKVAIQLHTALYHGTSKRSWKMQWIKRPVYFGAIKKWRALHRLSMIHILFQVSFRGGSLWHLDSAEMCHILPCLTVLLSPIFLPALGLHLPVRRSALCSFHGVVVVTKDQHFNICFLEDLCKCGYFVFSISKCGLLCGNSSLRHEESNE